jgi:hypothetical protein
MNHVFKEHQIMTKESRKPALIAICSAILFAGTSAQAAPRNEIEITYYKTAAKTEEAGSRLLSCSGRIYRSGRTSRHTTRIVTPCNSLNPLPESPDVPCDFKVEGCGPFGRP